VILAKMMIAPAKTSSQPTFEPPSKNSRPTPRRSGKG